MGRPSEQPDAHAGQRATGLPWWLTALVLGLAIVGAGIWVWWGGIATDRHTRAEGLLIAPAPGSRPRSTEAGSAASRMRLAAGSSGLLPQPTLVSLQLRGVQPRDAFAELARQSGMEILPAKGDLWDELRDQSIDLHLDRQPFWKAMLEICRQCGVYARTHGLSEKAVHVGRDSLGQVRCPTVVQGPFAVALHRIRSVSAVNLSEAKDRRQWLQAELVLFVEPKVNVFSIASRAQVEQAIDDTGQSLCLGQDPPRFEMSSAGQQWMFPIQLVLGNPARSARRIVQLRAHILLTVQGGVQLVEIENPLEVRDVAIALDNAILQFCSLSAGEGGYVAHFVVPGQASWPQVAQRFSERAMEVRLQEKNGRDLKYRSMSGGSSREGYEFSVLFSGSGQPGKLLITVPTGLRELHVPVAFADLPVP